ncbi:MAG: tyrosine-type recombinase/integrase [Candidatus Nitrosopolaris sp.]
MNIRRAMNVRGGGSRNKEIPRGEAYSNFVDSLRSAASRRTYTYCLRYYMAFRNSGDLDSIIAADLENPKLAEAKLKDFILTIRQQHKISQAYLNLTMASLRHLYNMNDVLLNWKKLSKFRFIMEESNADCQKKDRAYTHEDIQKMLSVASTKMKAMVLLLASSGMRVGAVPPLKCRHLMNVQSSEQIKQIRVYEGSKEEYITFCTPEAAKAIDDYLQFRQRSGETLTEDSPLFRHDFDVSDPFEAKNKVRRLKNTTAIASAFSRLLEKAGVTIRQTMLEGQRPGTIKKEVMRVHGLRKFANTQMIQSDMKGAAKEMLLGHSTGLDDKYYRPGDLLQEYLKAIDALTINEENRLKKKVEVLKAKRDEIEMLKGQVQQKEDRLSVIEKQMQSLVSTLSKLTEQGQVNAVAQTLYSSGILKEGITTK